MANPIYKVLGKRGRITIPFEIRQRVGFSANDILSFSESEQGQTVVIRREKICDHCRDAASPVFPDGKLALADFIDSLSEKEQRDALVYLSEKWAERFAMNPTEPP